MTLRPGTRCETHGTPAMGGFPAVPSEPLTICKPRAENLPLPGPGWHIVRYADGGKACMHESRFRVVDNRTRSPA
jgi:hypothetical protein